MIKKFDKYEYVEMDLCNETSDIKHFFFKKQPKKLEDRLLLFKKFLEQIFGYSKQEIEDMNLPVATLFIVTTKNCFLIYQKHNNKWPPFDKHLKLVYFKKYNLDSKLELVDYEMLFLLDEHRLQISSINSIVRTYGDKEKSKEFSALHKSLIYSDFYLHESSLINTSMIFFSHYIAMLFKIECLHVYKISRLKDSFKICISRKIPDTFFASLLLNQPVSFVKEAYECVDFLDYYIYEFKRSK